MRYGDAVCIRFSLRCIPSPKHLATASANGITTASWLARVPTHILLSRQHLLQLHRGVLVHDDGKVAKLVRTIMVWTRRRGQPLRKTETCCCFFPRSENCVLSALQLRFVWPASARADFAAMVLHESLPFRVDGDQLCRNAYVTRTNQCSELSFALARPAAAARWDESGFPSQRHLAPVSCASPAPNSQPSLQIATAALGGWI